MKRGGYLNRKTRLKANKPIRSSNPKRKARRFKRAYHSEARVQYVKTLRCCVPHCRSHRIENAHIETDGMGLKAPYDRVVALCSSHHRLSRDSLHSIGRAAFEALHEIDLDVEAEWTEEMWQTHGADYTEMRANVRKAGGL